jgi:hypothetical protein
MQRFLRDRLENVGIKRASQKSAVVTQLLVSNNRYESPYAAASPGFSPEASGPNLTVRFAWGFPEGPAYASLVSVAKRLHFCWDVSVIQ